MAAEEVFVADSQNLECVEIVYPPVSEVGIIEADDDATTPMVSAAQNFLTETNKKMHSYSLPMSSDSAGLVLLSHLCELSAKQPVLSDSENGEKDEKATDRVNVIVERIQNNFTNSIADITDRTASPVYNSMSDAFNENDYADKGSPASDPEVKISTSGKGRRVTKTLKFPPCFVCGGKASGSHYGVNSCEACKGFFRRYLMRHEEYKCGKGGNCKIINRNRGNCSGCRLKKCLLLGMAKEKSKLGRYTLARRTQTIKEVNKLEGKGGWYVGNCPPEHRYSAPETDILARNIKQNASGNCAPTNLISNQVVDILVGKLKDIKPFGPDIETIEDIQIALRMNYENYKVKTQLFGRLQTVPSDEYYKLYEDYGIDADGRMELLKGLSPLVEGIVERYCDFAKHIPEFCQLSVRDQSNLLKTSRCDFFVAVMHHGYSEEFQMVLGKNGKAHHLDETDKFCSKTLVFQAADMYKRWQKLNLNDSELALICALSLAFTDRCSLENSALVEKIQLNLVDLLQKELAITCEETAGRRLGKIIDNLTMMREGSELYMREYKELCKNKHVVQAMPFMTEFLLEEDA